MISKLTSEFRFFLSMPHNMRVLLITNMLYALVLPVVEIFMAAYIMRYFADTSYVAIFQVAMYTGIIITSLTNGFLLKSFKVAHLYSFGILLSGLSMVGMMFVKDITLWGLIISGTLIGAASGFFWTNRYLMALNTTKDENRNYFFGLESFFFTIANITIPLAIGALLSSIDGKQFFGIVFDVYQGYRVVTLIVFALTILACFSLARGKFVNPVQKDFLYFRFDRLWNKQILLAILKGLVQGFLVTAPAMLIMKYVGKEGSLGLIQSISGGLTAILIYVLGRFAKPKHRILIFGMGILLFLIGTIVNGIELSMIGVMIFVLCKVFFQPLHDLAYYPIMMKVMVNNIPLQQDVAGGHAWVLYSAYQKFGDERYLRRAKSATEALLNQKESRFYEILLPFGAYTAARLNAEQGTSYDVTKLLNTIFDGCKSKEGRTGWGVIGNKWGDYDVAGLQGSIVDGGGYGFFMNSVAMAWPLVPLVKYEPQYARSIGKYMLNVVNASRLFYPDQVDDAHQFLPDLKNTTHGIIGYEGVRKSDDYGKKELTGVSPVSTGDGPKWTTGQPRESMFSLYSTSIVGVFGAIVHKTEVEGILALDCNATDFYAKNVYPELLYYNPYSQVKTVTYSSLSSVDLFDILSRKYLARGETGNIKLLLPAGEASLVVVLPSGTVLKTIGLKIMAGETVISYK